MIKKILYSVLSFILLVMTVQFVLQIQSNHQAIVFTSEAAFLAFLLSLNVTGIFAFIGFVFPTHRLLPEQYFKIRNSKSVVRWYKLLGVAWFKKALVVFFWGKSRNRKRFFNGSQSGLDNLIYQSKQAEFGHLGAFVVLLLMCCWIGFLGLTQMAFIMLAINVVGNLYPVILQRHHRMRVERIQ